MFWPHTCLWLSLQRKRGSNKIHVQAIVGTAPGWRQWEDAWWVSWVPTSAGRETKLSKELQQGFCGLVLWLEEQEGCQVLPQCRLQLCLPRVPRKCFVCIRDRDSSESPWFTDHWGAAQGKNP